MEVSQTTAAVTSASAATTSDTNDATTISSDFETFLLMLTTQMQNQDPLNPIDSSDYAVQLATFSGVEQQVQTNDLLKSLSQQMGFMGMSQMAGWIGMEARVEAAAYFDGDTIEVMPTIAPEADAAYLVVQNQLGTEVQRIDIGLEGETVLWDGLDSNGDSMLEGQYSFYVESQLAEEVISFDQAAIYAPITEARNDDGTIMLVLEGGAEVEADSVMALR